MLHKCNNKLCNFLWFYVRIEAPTGDFRLEKNAQLAFCCPSRVLYTAQRHKMCNPLSSPEQLLRRLGIAFFAIIKVQAASL